MNQSTKRAILRTVHLIVTIPVLGYIYQPAKDVEQYVGAARFIFVPILILSGYWMYAGMVFAIIGVALWVSAFLLFGFGAAAFGCALLSQVALFIARKFWFVVAARHARTIP